MPKKVIKSQQGIEIIEDTDLKRLFMTIDGYTIFGVGVPTEYKDLMIKSFNNLVNIRKKDHDTR